MCSLLCGDCAEPLVQAALESCGDLAINFLPFFPGGGNLIGIQPIDCLIDPPGVLGATLRFHFGNDGIQRFANRGMR